MPAAATVSAVLAAAEEGEKGEPADGAPPFFSQGLSGRSENRGDNLNIWKKVNVLPHVETKSIEADRNHESQPVYLPVNMEPDQGSKPGRK